MTDLQDPRMRKLVLADIQTPQPAYQPTRWQSYLRWWRMCNASSIDRKTRRECELFMLCHVIVGSPLLGGLIYLLGSMGVCR